MINDMNSNCLVCNSKDLQIIYKNKLFGATTRRDKLLEYRVAQCKDCGHLQKVLNDEWYREIQALYEIDYNFQGKHINILDGKIISRDSVAVNRLSETLNLFSSGNILDFGCGDGKFLRSFGAIHPRWNLFGYELSELNKSLISNITNCTFVSGNIDNIDRNYFDLIVLNHVIEHLTDPTRILSRLHKSLKSDGHIAVRVPCVYKVNTDFTMLEHCSHFVPETLEYLMNKSGFEVVSNFDISLIEIGLICKKVHTQVEKKLYSFEHIERNAVNCISWSQALIKLFDSCLENISRPVGLFGVGGAGIWLGTKYKSRLSFFVDEDSDKVGKIFGDLIVLHPSEVPKEAKLIVAFNNFEQSSSIARRLKNLYTHFEVVIPEP